MSHEHDPDPEFLYPSDAEVVAIRGGIGGETRLLVAVRCPECDEVVELDATVTEISESDIELPLEGAADVYD